MTLATHRVCIKRRQHFIKTAVTLFLAALISAEHNSYAADVEQTMQFNIPAQSLESALTRFSADTRLQVLYEGNMADNLKAPALNGSYTPSQALQKLLSNSGLNYRYSNDKTITLEQSRRAVTTENQLDKTPEKVETTVLKPMTVSADREYDARDPYNTDYVLPNATSGTKTDTPIMETPLNVQVISKQVLKDQQVINLDKALRNVSGVTTFKDSGNGNNLFLRGFSTKTIFRNGFRMDAGITSFGNGQQFANVEGVEVLKGPAAILYGRVEPGGMVNIVTKQPRATPYYSLNQQFGSYELYRTSVDATGPLTKDDSLLYRVNASFQSNNTFRDLIKGEDVFFAPTLKWNISPRTQATLEMEYSRQLSNVDVQLLPFENNHFNDLPHNLNFGERNPVEAENIFVGFNWSHQFNDDWSIKHQVAFKRQDFNGGISAFPFFIHLDENKRPVDRSVSRVKATNDTVATNLDLTGHFKTWGLEHTLLFGGDYYRFDNLFDNMNGIGTGISTINLDNPNHPGPDLAVDPATRFLQKNYTDNYGLYAQDQIKLPYNVHVMGGLRYQYVHSTSESGLVRDGLAPGIPQTDDAVTPRVGLLWNPKKWLSLYSNYAENFGQNTGSFSVGNKLLPAESAQQWEVGAKTELFDGRLRATLAYYDLTKQNVATADFTVGHFCNGGGAGSCSIAVGEVRSQGPELDIQGEILPGWNVIATYANQDVRVTKSKGDPNGNGVFEVGHRLQFVPRNVGTVWTSYEVQQGDLKGFKIGGGVNLQDGVVNDTNTFKSTGYALVGLMTGYSFEVGKSKITAQLNIDNLLDKTYFTNAAPVKEVGLGYGTFSTPRTFMGSINVQY